ncbi:MAG: hypothetical protein J2P31_19965 [Blastocatellia bacterium]|nr:hypothetical protein [Blastocatellia bacterium]
MPGVNRTPCGCQRGYTGGWHYGMGRPVNQPYALGGHTLLGHLFGALKLPAGSHFRQGYTLNPDIMAADSSSGQSFVTDEIEGCLYKTGAFWNVTATKISSFFSYYPYFLIEGDTAVDFTQASDLTGLITDNLKNCVTSVGFDAIKTTDTLQIDAIPASLIGDPNTQQPTTGPGSLTAIQAAQSSGQQQQKAAGSPNPPATCDWNSMSFGQYLACELGFSDPIKSATAGALIGVGVIAVIAIVLARR